MKNNCYHCERRHVGCHATCEDYKEYKSNNEKLYKEKQKEMLEGVLSVERVCEKARLQAMRKKRRGK